MKEIGTYDAKTHFAELLDNVENGDVIVVTRRGKPVAKIIPYRPEQPMSIDDIIDGFKQLRKQVPHEGPSIREMIEEGRRL